MRRVIFYGDVPRSVKERLVDDYGVQVVLDAPNLQRWMLGALQEGAYDLVVVDGKADKAARLAQIVRQTRRIPVVELNGDRDPSDVLDTILRVARWTPETRTAFVVVTATKGGVGKSTISGALAEVLSADEGSRVLVVDDNPHQYNLIRFFTGDDVPIVTVADMKTRGDELRRWVYPLHDNLDAIAPEEYTSAGGVTFALALSFWQAVAGLGYDYVIVDTSPSIPAPDSPTDWTDVHLSSGLMTGEFPAVYVVPFTPVGWGVKGLEATRDMLARWQQLEYVIPVVVATDALHVMELVPDWVRTGTWRDRLQAIPYSRRLRDESHVRAFQDKQFVSDPRASFRPLAKLVASLGKRRLQKS